MYQKFFGLTHRPFSATPDTHILYNSNAVRLCLNELENALRQGEGIGLLTAAAGTGKTLLCKVLGERLANDPLPVLLLNSTFPTRSSLLQAILFELGRPYIRLSEQELRLELVSYGRKIAESQTGIALIVDEAHLLGEHILEELRALTNFMYQSRPIFRVVLSGQMALEDLLARRSLEAVNQRLKCHVSLETLNRQESLEYVITRVEYAGGKLLDLFTERALELIIHAADGLPRCLNQLCDHALLLASISGDVPVQPEHVREALEDLQKLPLHWNVSIPTQDPVSEWKQTAPSRKVPLAEADIQTGTSGGELEISFQSRPTTGATFTTPNVFEIGAEVSPGKTLKEIPQAVDEEILAGKQGRQEIEASIEYVDLPEQKLQEIEQELLDESSVQTQANTVNANDLCAEREDEDELRNGSKILAELEEELLEEVTEMRKQVIDSGLLKESEEVAQPVNEEEEAVSIEELHDHYAVLDARRRSQHSVIPAAKHRSFVGSQAEYHLGQSVIALHDEIQDALMEQDEDYVPTPEQILHRAVDSSEAKYDVIDPESGAADFDELYSQLRKRTGK